MKIVIDNAIPFMEGVFKSPIEVCYLPGNKIDSNAVRNADALIIRTRTECRASLLEGSTIKHIATATIGFNHIDLDYCHAQQIGVSTAAGCNARAVLQWVGAALVHLSKIEGWSPAQKTLGIVGVGNIGSLIKQYAENWGFKVICCDPPRQKAEGGDFVSIEDIARKADIITLHTPLDTSTYHLINQEILSLMKSDATLLNAARGEVVDTEALLESGRKFGLDVWENEPNISADALNRAIVATTHIAGYSIQGKANATSMAVSQIATAFDLSLNGWQPPVKRVEPQDISWDKLTSTISKYFDIVSESNHLKSHPEEFEDLRNNYNYRTEYF